MAKGCHTILDIGANTGLYSILSRKVNKEAKIFAFEPYAINANRLKKNLLLNDIKDVEIIEKALGDKEGEVEFAIPDKDQVCDVLSADTEFTKKFYRKWISYRNVKVPQTCLDNFVSKKNIGRLDLIKIDVENYETFVLLGAVQSLQKFAPIILIEIFVDQDKIAFYDKVIKPLGYHCYSILTEGIIRTESLIDNPNCRNFILSKVRSKQEFLSFTNMNDWIGELKHPNLNMGFKYFLKTKNFPKHKLI